MEIIEIDGPPIAAFGEYRYRTVAFIGADAAGLLKSLRCFLHELRAELENEARRQAIQDPAIIWRLRPTWKSAEDQIHRVRCRLDTHPRLPESFWAAWEKPESAYPAGHITALTGEPEE